MKKTFLYLSLSIVTLASVQAQQLFLPLQQESSRVVEGELIKRNKNLHSSIRPYLQSDIEEQGVAVDSLMDAWYSNAKEEDRSWLYRKLFQEHLLQYKDDKINISADLLFDIAPGYEKGKGLIFSNTRGVQLQGNLGKKFSFYTALYENLSRFPGYVDAYTRQRRVVPGQGFARPKNGNQDWDYALPVGYVSFTPNEYFNFQFGQDKNFLGDGYRSLILSDFAYSYPFFKINTTFWKIKYTNLWTQYMDISNGFVGPRYPKKYATYNYLSFLPSPKWNISIFQSMIWGPDSGSDGSVELAYLNPIIFMNAVNFNMGSPGNSMMGANLRYNFLNRYSAYGQFVLDDFNIEKLFEGSGFFQQKVGYQLGLKAFDLFGIPNMYAQAEYNHVRPYVYGHKLPSLNNAHYNEPLAHPFGANFNELILIGGYRIRRFDLNTKFNISRYGADANGIHYGKNIFLSDYDAPGGEFTFGNYTGQGVATNFYYNNSTLSYLLNPRTNMKLQAGYTFRRESSSLVNSNAHIVYFGIKTDLINRYYDF
ncbi:hypothetical protein [Pontibacter sp. SGAir0037]|uniref:hypothetical protein n=1 Tax=Pontibacter sp. SGAir0037 TaxID=2571030 RepID=UPI0010CD2A7E|nr:hypothetical protein [Pontibacter sp. SGAir0037]QCR20993.1 hypothetical protein C1N53_00505 [Pontibacter sp. SGAir0037]